MKSKHADDLKALVLEWWPGAKPENAAAAARLLVKHSLAEAETVIRQVIADGNPPTPSRVGSKIAQIEREEREARNRSAESERRRRKQEKYDAYQRLWFRAKQAMEGVDADGLAQLYDDALTKYPIDSAMLDTMWARPELQGKSKRDAKAYIVGQRWLAPIVMQTLIEQGALDDREGAFERTPAEQAASDEAERLIAANLRHLRKHAEASQ